LLVLMLMNAKHPGYGDHYLLPLAATLPVLCAAGLDRIDLWPKKTQLLVAALGLVALAVFGRTMRSGMLSYKAESDWLGSADAATENMLVRLAEERHVPRESLRTLWTYGTASPCFALWYGDDSTAAFTFHNDIAEICRHDAKLNLDLDLATYLDWDVAVLTEGLVAELNPVVRPPGSTAYPSSIDSPRGFGKLVFLTRQ
ncbi:MAG: hypothetical protein M3069_33330, partial [Chloroflexota bacterium]|nr:hypothetical protein [Chloroflexota bacterium]